MNILIIFSLCFLATAKVTLQSRFGKRTLSTKTDGIIFNALVFLTAAILFGADIPNASLAIWLFSGGFAVFTVIFQLSYTNALSQGNVSLTVMMVNLSMLFPVLTSVIFYHERLTHARIIGIAFIVLSFLLCVDVGDKKTVSRSWLILTVLATLANGSIGITQKVFGASRFHTEKKAFVACSYLLAFIITFTIYAVSRLKGKETSAHRKAPTYLFSISVGIILAIFQLLNTYAISVIDGSFLFPVYSGGSIILSTLVGVLFFKDKLTVKQTISIIIGIIAVIIMNL
ncbi:MAG: GRP family sugar transporter [Eubacteriales bacterium]|nr:GRP family sugar transporter [Eubacteriales bacterium]